MASAASDLSRALARQAEAVCRHYLREGHREGQYWTVGDAQGSPGRSLYVRLKGSEHGKGAAGKWTDAATGEHGDLLDLIGLNQGHRRLADTLEEARRFLSLPPPVSDYDPDEPRPPRGSRKAARRLFAASRPIAGTLAEAYLAARGITGVRAERWLRFHPHCWYRPNRDDAPGTANAFPALIAAVTDLAGTITGVHRTFLGIGLDGTTTGKAQVATPRRAMGDLLGAGVRFGTAAHSMIAGEGLETVLSLRVALPTVPMIATLSSAHLAALEFPDCLRRLYVARDRDPAGHHATQALAERAEAAQIEMTVLDPVSDDFNTDLRRQGREAFTKALSTLFPADDRDRLFARAA